MISILTPTIAGREAALERCKASVQLRIPYEHVVVPDDPPSGGPARAIAKANRLARYPWRLFLPDDDELVPDGVTKLVQRAVERDLDFAIGLQGDIRDGSDSDHADWRYSYPEAGATGAFVFHERMNAIAELPAESLWPERRDERGNDYLLLRRWVHAGAVHAFFAIPVLIHRASP